jgi:hypothetical protein
MLRTGFLLHVSGGMRLPALDGFQSTQRAACLLKPGALIKLRH